MNPVKPFKPKKIKVAKFKDPFDHPQFANNQSKKWTDEQKSNIQDPMVPIAEAARKSGRTIKAVQVKRSKLKFAPPKKK